MAKTKARAEAVRLLHANGAAVSVSADKATRLVAGGQFTSEDAAATASTAKGKKPARKSASRKPAATPPPATEPDADPAE